MPYYILDTETTGLGKKDQVIEIAIIDNADGSVILNTLLSPPLIFRHRLQRFKVFPMQW